MNILERDKDKIQEKVRLIEEGALTAEDIEILLIRLRYNIVDGKIRELCHFAAHSEKDRGHTVITATPMLENMIKAIEKGGTFTLSPIFKRKDLIDELILHFKKLGIQFDEIDIHYNETNIINSLFNFLSGIEIKFRIPTIKETKLIQKNIDNNLGLWLEVTPKGLRKIPDGVKFAINIIE